MKNETWESTIKPIVVLSCIALITSLLLAVINGATAPVIAENERITTLNAYVDVIPTVSDPAQLELAEGLTADGVVGGALAPDGSVAIKAGASGFDGGTLTVIMGFAPDGAVTGVWVDATTQTAGIGSLLGNAEYGEQFIGRDGSQNVVMGEDGLDGRTGATISSKALFAAVNSCINGYNELAG